MTTAYKGSAPIAFGDERLPARFWAKVEVNIETGCWEWLGGRGQGYGKFQLEGRNQSAHRVIHEALIGPIPNGLVIDHLCRVRHCVNPAHLEPVTNRENILRGEGKGAQFARMSRCAHGHEFTPENTHQGKYQRFCRACWRDKSQRRRTEGLPSPDDSRHGTLAGYASYGCRCEACRTAVQTYNQQRRESVA